MSQRPAVSLQDAYATVLDAVFPPRCASCRTFERDLFCPACRAGLCHIVPPFCATCGLPFDPLALAAAECPDCRAAHQQGPSALRLLRSVYTFEGPLRDAVHRLKYQEKVALAAPLAQLLYDALSRPPTCTPALPVERLRLLIPVPLHPWRRYRRGYNQSLLLARELSRLVGVPVGEVLRRRRHTQPQVELSASRRAQNVAGAFAFDAVAWQRASAIDGAVLLIDDVCTTGATLRDCARALHEGGVTEIYALTLARQL